MERFIATINSCELDPIEDSGLYLLSSTAPIIRWLDRDLTSSSLIVRKCYQTISTKILEKVSCDKFLISGSPGIGKSTFLSFFVYQLIQLQREKQSIQYHC
jgi:predicted NACHT family NTPase